MGHRQEVTAMQLCAMQEVTALQLWAISKK